MAASQRVESINYWITSSLNSCRIIKLFSLKSNEIFAVVPNNSRTFALRKLILNTNNVLIWQKSIIRWETIKSTVNVNSQNCNFIEYINTIIFITPNQIITFNKELSKIIDIKNYSNTPSNNIFKLQGTIYGISNKALWKLNDTSWKKEITNSQFNKISKLFAHNISTKQILFLSKKSKQFYLYDMHEKTCKKIFNWKLPAHAELYWIKTNKFHILFIDKKTGCIYFIHTIKLQLYKSNIKVTVLLQHIPVIITQQQESLSISYCNYFFASTISKDWVNWHFPKYLINIVNTYLQVTKLILIHNVSNYNVKQIDIDHIIVNSMQLH